MVLLLDFLGLVLVIKDGNKKPYLQIGWCFAAICILAATLHGKNQTPWGAVEYLSLSMCLTAVVLWRMLSARIGIYAYAVAFVVSGVPLLVDYWHHPLPETLRVWNWSVATCVLSIIANKGHNIANTLVPAIAILVNATIAILCVI